MNLRNLRRLAAITIASIVTAALVGCSSPSDPEQAADDESSTVITIPAEETFALEVELDYGRRTVDAFCRSGLLVVRDRLGSVSTELVGDCDQAMEALRDNNASVLPAENGSN